jgi:hypothetical protein
MNYLLGFHDVVNAFRNLDFHVMMKYDVVPRL